MTRFGNQCNGYSLVFIDRPACHNHATEEERARNRESKPRYEERLTEVLRTMPMPEEEV